MRTTTVFAFTLAPMLVILQPLESHAAGKSPLERAARALQAAAKKKAKLSPFFAKQIKVSYSTSDRSAGTCVAAGVFTAQALDGVITLKGRVSGTNWLENKKIVPHDKQVKLDLRRQAHTLIDALDAKAARCANRDDNNNACVDEKKQLFTITEAATSIAFVHKRVKGRYVVVEVRYSVEDPG